METASRMSQSDMIKIFQTNLVGLINITQQILPTMLSQGANGCGDIVNIGSIAGRSPYAGASIYSASKAAVRAFTNALRQELVATRIRVMEISPGLTRTDLPKVRFSGNEQAAKEVYE